MADQNTEQSKSSPGCFARMREMMRDMMSGKGVSCCSCADAMTRMMPECCARPTGRGKPG